ncbi:hypothetical protein [Chlamydia avium]|nr:hypothetical protein [Chlamydia avium]
MSFLDLGFFSKKNCASPQGYLGEGMHLIFFRSVVIGFSNVIVVA